MEIRHSSPRRSVSRTDVSERWAGCRPARRDHYVLIVTIEVGKLESLLFPLKRSDVSNKVVDVLLTRRIVNWIECLKTRPPDRHVFRTMRTETLAKGQHNSHIAGRKLILMSL